MNGIEALYISCACNRTPHAADWGRNGLICYAACHAIAIYDPKYAGAGKIVRTLSHHKGRVNSVEWVKLEDGGLETEFVSASTDKTAVVWTRVGAYDYYPSAILKGHSDIVTIATCIYLPDQTKHGACKAMIVVTASVDSTVKIWKRNQNKEEVLCQQSVSLGSGLCLSVSLCLLPASQLVLLACAVDDARIHLYAETSVVGNPEATELDKVDSLIGHEDWVRALDFTIDDGGDVLLASCAQDALVRLWRISPTLGVVRKPISELEPGEGIQLEERVFTTMNSSGTSEKFAVTLESVLAGHEGWVYGVHWHPPVYTDGGKTRTQPMKLLTSSLDKTMIVWQPDLQSGVWLEAVRVGEVGGNTLGFYGARFGPGGSAILGHGYQGSFHLWLHSEETGLWKPGVTVGGHFGEVLDMQWEPSGEFLLTASTDQTTRLHAPWVRDGAQEVTWHELARPQVHGYDLSCLTVLSRFRFASGAEEKVVRTFQAPRNFRDNFRNVCRVADRSDEGEGKLVTPHGASVPALGLSNKAVYQDQEILREGRHIKDEYPEAYFVPIHLTEPPTEENLLQNTLWPEVQKLYGHGYELFSLAARPDGCILASACKAAVAKHADIILWETSGWQQVQRLASHNLTVTQISFSPDGSALLSVSRDRRWSVFRKELPDGDRYQLEATSDPKSGVHTRIIWCCSWSHDSLHFATGSRDGKVAVWGSHGVATEPLHLQGQSVTAVALAPGFLSPGVHLLSVGLESGHIELYLWGPDCGWEQCCELDNGLAHHLAVKKLAFRPVKTGPARILPIVVQLASCGCDHTVKIHNICTDKLAALHSCGPSRA